MLRTKLYPPEVGGDLIARPRVRALLGGEAQAPLTLVVAPAGYGKSLAVARWSSSLRIPVAWLSLDVTDTELAEFLRYLVAAVRSLHPESCAGTAALLNAPTLAPLPVVSATLANDLDLINAPFLLVLDDYHRVGADSAVHTVIECLLSHPPRALHLVIVTRSEPPLNLVRLRACGRLTDVVEHDLRFTDLEAAALLEQITGCSVDDDTLRGLQDRLEGWAVGLRLVALATHGIEDLRRLPGKLRAGVASVREYLVQEVIAVQPVALRDWILKTSILDRFCAGLCTAVCAPEPGTESAALTGHDFLQRLCRSNLFVVSLDDQGQWFRFHHLFQQEVQAQLRHRLGRDAITALHRRASAWFADAGLIDEAIQQALASGDELGAARLVEAHRCAEIQTVPWYLSAKWLAHLPERLKQERPGLLMAQAWLLFGQHRPADSPPKIEALRALGAVGETDPLLPGEIDFFRGLACYYEVESGRSRESFAQALARLPESSGMMRSTAYLYYAGSLQKAGQADSAVRLLRGLTRPTSDGMSPTISHEQMGLIAVHLFEADLGGAQREVELADGLPLYSGAAITQGLFAYLAASVCFHRNAFAPALRRLQPNLDNRFLLYRRTAIDSLAMFALASQALGDSAAATATIAMLEQLATHNGDRESYAVSRSCAARIALMSGDLGRAIEAMQTDDETASPAYMMFWSEIPRLTKCRVQIAAGTAASIASTLPRLQQYERENRKVHDKLQLIEVLALKALALQGLARTKEALAALREAVILAEPGGVTRPIVELGLPVVSLLEQLEPGTYDASFISRVLAALDERQASASAWSPPFLGMPPPCGDPAGLDTALTRRESEILALLRTRLSDKEIAHRLTISPSTVNTHLKRIYRKLGVSTRRQAVAGRPSAALSRS
ncbi:LuxR C-terminal-related transcriptional regulator [uncultured Thiodictyon sp.]|uniref:LuxR C-terminal-related transcriptional regulator n=1 Tax=uncultured Thiodictyon sp. TaxID=1846217 RepID=UPI0025DFF1D2|nr:LuxR C-terminal-related transcriptional regulator [uncultured Thiodictyon sp.]